MAGPIAISVDKAKSDGLRELRACVGCVIVALDGFAGFAAQLLLDGHILRSVALVVMVSTTATTKKLTNALFHRLNY